MFESFKPLMESFLEIGVPGFDAIILKDGQCVFRHRAGFSDVEKQIPMQGNERYNIYSCTKMITCAAALQLWEQGLIGLDDPLSAYLPEYAEMMVLDGENIVAARTPITLRHVLTMTAGFTYDFNSPSMQKLKESTNGQCSTRDVARAVAQEPLLFEPGTQWRYSLGHDILGAVIEVVAGMPFSQYVKQHIFTPLGMQRSSIGASDAELETVTPLYHFKRETSERTCLGKTDYSRLNVGKQFESGGAGCISTVEDFVKFLEAMRVGDTILKRSTIDMMVSDQLTEEQRKTFWWGHRSSFGFGVHCGREGVDHPFFGWGGAAGAEPLVDREHGITFFFARNILGMHNDPINDSMREHLRSLL